MIDGKLISTLCHRLAEQFSFKYIYYENFSKLKNEIKASKNVYAGFIIDHFPTSIDDLNRFQSEVRNLFLRKSRFHCFDRLVRVQF